jgi:hypothetical protein
MYIVHCTVDVLLSFSLNIIEAVHSANSFFSLRNPCFFLCRIKFIPKSVLEQHKGCNENNCMPYQTFICNARQPERSKG